MRRKKLGMFILCYVFSKAFVLRNLCYSKISVLMLLGYRTAGIVLHPIYKIKFNIIYVTCGKTVTFFDFRKGFTISDVCAGALSCNTQTY